MSWKPIPIAQLQQMIHEELAECSEPQRTFFAQVAIVPERWHQSPYGDEGGGFWSVAVYQDRVLWFNDIEWGFNVSRFRNRGEIPSDECNQDPLKWAIPHLMGEPGLKAGPPQPMEDE
jgi:hypothetical protein